MINLSGD